MKFYSNHRLICWWPTGLVDRATVLWYYDQLKACEWGNHANRFCDFSAVTDFQFDHIGLKSLASHRKRELSDHQNINLVTRSSSALGFGMARMYQAFMEDWPINCYVESDLDRCAEILGVPVDYLLEPKAP
ncbi:MAG: hypothetical protein KDN20_00895 [Verrucomicrobiae bacterium]|nr:hypothetical protein [Verrucomicrobiae bacterium]